jgi:nucleotide-binding universal stress UspA family protein
MRDLGLTPGFTEIPIPLAPLRDDADRMTTATIPQESSRATTGPVIVGIDHSSAALDAIVLGHTLADALGRSAVLAHVYPLNNSEARAPFAVLENAPQDLRDAVAARRSSAGDRTELVRGRSAAKGLRALAVREEAAAIVVGSSSASTLGRILLGTTGESLAGDSAIPVAVAPAGYAETEPRIAAIGCGFDGSETSRAALRWAGATARAADATLRVIGVHEPMPSDRFALTSWLRTPAFSAVVREQQERRLEIGAVEFADGLAVEPQLRDGTTADVLIDASATLDLLVLGTRGLGRIRGAALGSVSAAVVRAAHSPVVVVPSPAR